VNELLARAEALFVAPARAVLPPPPDLVGVIAGAADLQVAAGGVAADLRARHRARTALVCCHDSAHARPATHAARVLARRLGARDLHTAAAGALCHAAGPDPRDHRRAITGAAGVPAVVALAGRDERLDELLCEADLLVLAVRPDAEPAYTELARASLAALGPPCELVHVPLGFAARRTAALGLTRLRPLSEATA
jgi:hypothetical protein